LSLDDQEKVGTVELAADGSDVIFSGKTVVSTTTGTKVVVLSGVDLFREPEQLENGDKVTLSGTTAADGTYTVDQVTALDTFTVQEAIATSTGGTCDAKYPSGAAKVGVDTTALTNLTATDLQTAIEQIDPQLGGGGGGQANTQTNVGGGVELGKPKSGVDLPIRTLEADGGIDIEQKTDTVGFRSGWRHKFFLMGG
jgi:hypothetical protein